MILSLDNWWIAPNLLDVDIFQEIFSERSKLGAGARNTSLSIFWIISFPTRVKNLIRWSLNSAPRNKPHHPNQSFLSFRKGFPDHITHPRRLCNRITTSFTNKEKTSGLFRIGHTCIDCILWCQGHPSLHPLHSWEQNENKTIVYHITKVRFFFNSSILPQSPIPNPSSFKPNNVNSHFQYNLVWS